jgi:hypothetical protein
LLLDEVRFVAGASTKRTGSDPFSFPAVVDADRGALRVDLVGGFCSENFMIRKILKVKN